MTTIKDVKIQYFDPPLAEYLEDAKHGIHTHFELVTVTITDADGLTGTGYTYTGGKGGRSIQAMITHDLVPYLMEQDSQNIDLLHDGMQWHVHYVARGGIASFAISAVDIALWDLRGKRLSTSLLDMAGGTQDRCNAYRGGIDLGYDLPRLLQSIDAYMDSGFDAVKIKIGQPELVRDIERIRAVRAQIGDQRTFMVDANYAFGVEQAITASKAMEDQNIMITKAMLVSPMQRIYHLRWVKTCIQNMNLSMHWNKADLGIFNPMHPTVVVLRDGCAWQICRKNTVFPFAAMACKSCTLALCLQGLMQAGLRFIHSQLINTRIALWYWQTDWQLPPMCQEQV